MSNLVVFTLDVNKLPEPTVRQPVAPELISGDAPTLCTMRRLATWIAGASVMSIL